MRRAALHFVEISDLVAERLADTRVWLRDELEVVFDRELARRAAADRRDLVAALDMATSWEAWNLLRDGRGLLGAAGPADPGPDHDPAARRELTTMQVDHAGHRVPAARSRPGRAGHAGAGRRPEPALRLRSGRAHAGGRRAGVGAGGLPRRVPDPPAQRPHHRPQRRHHHAVGHELRARLRCTWSGRWARQAFVERTLAVLRDDIGYRVTHHDDLTWEPMVEVTEVSDGVVLDEERRARHRRAHRSPPGPPDGRLPDRATTAASVVIAGDTKPCAGLDRLCAEADLYVQTVVRRLGHRGDPGAAAARHPRLPLRPRGGGRHGQPQRRGHAGPDPPRPGPAARERLAAEWVAEAAVGFSGTVLLAEDLQVFDV